MCTHSKWASKQTLNSPKWLTLNIFKLHTWHHTDIATVHCIHLKKLHMYTTFSLKPGSSQSPPSTSLDKITFGFLATRGWFINSSSDIFFKFVKTWKKQHFLTFKSVNILAVHHFTSEVNELSLSKIVYGKQALV